MATQREWALAYARQAEVDLRTYGLLNREPTPDCHRLQFLQMACEKLCKAHLCEGGAAPESLQGSHAYIAGTLPVILKKTYAIARADAHQGAWVLQHAKHLAAEIEVLAPAVKRAGTLERRDNCEYPWEDESGTLQIPLKWRFQPSQLLDCPAGRLFVKLVRGAIDRITNQ
jgi:hypothetical protein